MGFWTFGREFDKIFIETGTGGDTLQTLLEQSYRIIGDNVYRFRMLQHMTQEQLAERSHVSGSYISQIERANLHKGITCTAMIQIAESLNVPACILMALEPCQNYLDCLSRAAMHRPAEDDLPESADGEGVAKANGVNLVEGSRTEISETIF